MNTEQMWNKLLELRIKTLSYKNYIVTCWKCGHKQIEQFVNVKSQIVDPKVKCNKCGIKVSDTPGINLLLKK